MKKAIFLLLFTFTISLSAQSIRVYNLNVAPENAASVGDLFKEYHENGKRKSGNVTLQRVRFQKHVSHRVIITGDPNNWGSAIERPESDWRAYLRGTRAFRKPSEGSYTARSAYWKNGDREKLIEYHDKKGVKLNVYNDEGENPLMMVLRTKK